MANGRLKVVRVLGNPKPKGKRKLRRPAAKPKKATRSRSRKRLRAIGQAQRFALRVIDSGRRALWWNGKSWTAARIKAAKYSKGGAAAKLATIPKPAGWVVADAIAV